MSTLPLAKPELRPSLVPHHAPSRSQDDSGERSRPPNERGTAPAPRGPRHRVARLAGINVSRNPSDASEKSTSSAGPDDEAERGDKDRASVEDEREKAPEKAAERERDEDRRSVDKDEHDREEKHK